MEFLKKILNYISSHFLLRNVIMATCLIILALFVTNVTLNLYTKHGQKIPVPNLDGKTVVAAQEICDDENLKIIVIDSLYVPKAEKGTILDQSPKANMNVKSGRKIFVTINASKPRMEQIPYVVGFSLRQAKNMLENKGFEIKELIYKNDIATNNVLLMNFNGKNIIQGEMIQAELGQKITLTVGRNHSSPLPMVPKVLGLSLREAKSRLWESGLNIGEIKTDNKTVKPNEIDNAKVYRQIPNQQMRALFGGKVTLYLTNDIKNVVSGEKRSNNDARQFTKPAVDSLSVDSTEVE